MNATSRQAKVNRLVSRLNQPAWYWPFAILLAGFYVATSLYISAHRLLWYDEIFTAIMSRLPTVRTMWQAISEGVESIPVAYFLITRLFDQLFHHADIGIRVPSALALGMGLLVTFDVARRLTDGLYGLIAISFLTNSIVTYYGYEARPYALCFMLAAMALWLWVVTEAESKAAAIAFGAVFFIGGTVHYYFLLCMVPFGILGLADRRILHRKVIAAAAGATCSLAVLYPQIVSSLSRVNGGGFGGWALPTTVKLQAVYLEFFPLAMIPLVLIVVGVAVFGTPRERLVTCMSSGERVSWLFLTVPLATYIVARLVTQFFYNRYMIGAVPGIVVAVTCLFWRHCRESRYLSLALLVVFGGYGIRQQLSTLRHIDKIEAFGDHQGRTRQMLAMEDTLERDGKRHIAVSSVDRSNLLFLEAWYYSTHPEKYEYITSQPVGSIGKYAALNFVSVEDIVPNARQTAVINPEPALLDALQRRGLHLKVRCAEPIYVVYLE